MGLRKYAKDYRLVRDLDEKGHLSERSEYVGARYAFESGLQTARSAISRMLVPAFSCWAFALTALLAYGTASTTVYVALPFVFVLLPLWQLCAALLRLRRAGESMDHRTADLANDRLPACCLWLMLLPGVALLGEIAALTFGRGAFLAGDALFIAGAVLTGGCGYVCFRLKDKCKTKPI